MEQSTKIAHALSHLRALDLMMFIEQKSPTYSEMVRFFDLSKGSFEPVLHYMMDTNLIVKKTIESGKRIYCLTFLGKTVLIDIKKFCQLLENQ